MPNKIWTLPVVILILCSCSKRDLNLPQPSPMPHEAPRAGEAPQASETPKAEPAGCAIQFSSQLTLAEVAIRAYEMQERCNYNRDEILKLAGLAAGAGVVPNEVPSIRHAYLRKGNRTPMAQ